MKKFDLNAPAFGSGAEKVSETEVEETKVEEEVKTEEPLEEGSKVPYSRFKKFHDEAKKAREEAEYWRQQAESVKNEPAEYAEDLPSQWVKLYGDDEKSKEAWKVQQDLNRQIREEAIREAREAVRNERLEEIQRTEENVEVLDSNFESLAELVGRDLSEAEQSAVLDIVDKYTPKDREGNYAGEIMSFEDAWEIYELKTQSAKKGKIEARDNVASLSGNRTQGETLSQEERDKNFNPSWGALGSAIRNRLV